MSAHFDCHFVALTNERRIFAGGGPEVPIDPALLQTFEVCFLDLLAPMLTKYEWCIVPDTTLLSQSEPNKWLHLLSEIQSSRFSSMDFPQTMVKLVHKNVSCPSPGFSRH